MPGAARRAHHPCPGSRPRAAWMQSPLGTPHPTCSGAAAGGRPASRRPPARGGVAWWGGMAWCSPGETRSHAPRSWRGGCTGWRSLQPQGGGLRRSSIPTQCCSSPATAPSWPECPHPWHSTPLINRQTAPTTTPSSSLRTMRPPQCITRRGCGHPPSSAPAPCPRGRCGWQSPPGWRLRSSMRVCTRSRVALRV